MAEKKYIGKPGKQDDPCWKGYEMVGMKKKGGRKVPNCVPEAREIIEKAKAKSKKDPLTGAKIDKDRFILPEENELDEALTRVTSGNKGYGYHGNVEARDDAEKDKRYSAMHRYAKKLVGDAGHLQDAKKPNVMVKHFLDSAHGRHIADNPTDTNIKSRFAHFKKSYDPAMHEEVEAIDELSKDAMLNYLHANKHKNTKGGNPRRDLVKSMRGTDLAVRKYTAKPGSKYVRVPATEEVELDEAYGMWKVDFPKQHAGKPVAAGSVHVKAQNTAHAHKVAAKRVGVDHTLFKSKVTKSSVLPEEKEDLPWHEDPKNPTRKSGERKDEYGNKIKNVAKHLAKKAMKANVKEEVGQIDESLPKLTDNQKYAAIHRHVHGKTFDAISKEMGLHRQTVATHAGNAMRILKKRNVDIKDYVKEELGKDNEWGRPELRKKYAAMTPGQESMAADKIPTFDPRYDDVTTQYCGGIREGYLAEISAKGAEARAKFQAKVRQTLADPKNIARAKKTLAKKKEAEKAKEAPHLVMQLRKAVSIGSKVHFQDGQHHTIAPNHADIFMSKYNSAKSSIEKEALQKRAHKSHSEFMKTIAEGVHENCGTPDCCQMCDTAEMGTHHVDSYEAHRGSGDQISPVISHDDDDIRFQDFDEAEMEKELEAEVLALKWDDIVDFYDDEEVEYVENPEFEDEDEVEEIEEAITPAGRLKKKFNAMRTKSRRMMARNIAIKRVSTPEKIKSRSIRTARRMVYKRLLRNRDISTVSAAEKTRLEAQVKRMAPMVARLSVRVMPQVRKLEQSRIKNSRTRKKK